MSLGEMLEDFLSVIKPRPRYGLFVRLRDSGAITTIKRSWGTRLAGWHLIAIASGLALGAVLVSSFVGD